MDTHTKNTLESGRERADPPDNVLGLYLHATLRVFAAVDTPGVRTESEKMRTEMDRLWELLDSEEREAAIIYFAKAQNIYRATAH